MITNRLPREIGDWGIEKRCPNDCAGSCPACQCSNCLEAEDENGLGSRCSTHDENGPPDSHWERLRESSPYPSSYARELVLAGRGYLQ